jgi:hypothetical protein
MMGKFLLGVVVTLAVIYPSVTKHYIGSAVDVTHNVVTNVMEQSKREKMGLDANERIVDQ